MCYEGPQITGTRCAQYEYVVLSYVNDGLTYIKFSWKRHYNEVEMYFVKYFTNVD